jgi:hypothetical protein
VNFNEHCAAAVADVIAWQLMFPCVFYIWNDRWMSTNIDAQNNNNNNNNNVIERDLISTTAFGKHLKANKKN